MVPNRTRRARGIFNVPTTLYFFCNLNGLGFAKTILWGMDFAKPRLSYFWNSAGVGTAGENQIRNPILCLVPPAILSVAQGYHPRHPPRAFPLGLLAPRCLRAVNGSNGMQ